MNGASIGSSLSIFFWIPGARSHEHAFLSAMLDAAEAQNFQCPVCLNDFPPTERVLAAPCSTLISKSKQVQTSPPVLQCFDIFCMWCRQWCVKVITFWRFAKIWWRFGRLVRSLRSHAGCLRSFILPPLRWDPRQDFAKPFRVPLYWQVLTGTAIHLILCTRLISPMLILQSIHAL